jgi:outer membrane lipoprotein carrier protein
MSLFSMYIKRKNILFLILAAISLNVLSQPADFKLVTGTARTEIEKKIVAEAKKITSLQCKFEQEKASVLLTEKAISKGILMYKSPASLRWEYTEPNKYILVFHQGNASMKDEKGAVIQANKMLKQLGNFIVSAINGKSLTDNENFQIEYYENEKNKQIVWVKLIPIPKKLKEMYNSIQIKISTSDYLASEIIMEEKSGDIMKIFLSEKKINENIPVNLFSIQ